MADLQDINYALISALYANKTSGLYSDVYFPIIKYTIVQLFNNKNTTDGKAFYTATDVQSFINERFKIYIPTIVLTKSLEKIEKTKKNFVDLTLMEHGSSFQIKKIWDAQEFDKLAEREVQFTEGLKSIESDYKIFLEKNGIFDDGVSYLQFISDNTQEVLGYFQNNDTSVIDEKYTTIIFFLEYLHNTPSKKDEFYIADQLFWASIIAGYLKSEKPLVNEAEEGSVKEYFLDTSILLGMLELSTKQKETYASEIKEIIEKSGGAMRVHPMTLEEIKIILSSVESSGIPDPGTDIAEAWENHHLTINKIAQIRYGLQGLLEKQGVKMLPTMGAEGCRRIVMKYKGRKVVEELASERSMKHGSYSQDNFREIHDLFMDDYIEERRKGKTISEDVVFVTANRDLISFTRNLHPDVNYMMSTGRIILDLWMHSVKPVNISGCALTETMARCLDQHNMRVRNKIVEVSRFFNENKGNFDAQVYQDFIKKLYRRAKNVIMTVEADPDRQNTLDESTVQRIIDAVKADQEFTDKRVREIENNKSEIEHKYNNERKEKESLADKNRAQEEHIDSLEQEKQELAEQVAAAQGIIDAQKSELEKESVEKQAAEDKVALYKERDILLKELEQVEADLAPLELQRQKSFSNACSGWLIILGIFLIVAAIIVCWFSIKKQQYWYCLVGLLAPLGLFFLGRANTLNDKKDTRKEKAFKSWEERPENKKFLLLTKKHAEIKNLISEIEGKL